MSIAISTIKIHPQRRYSIIRRFIFLPCGLLITASSSVKAEVRVRSQAVAKTVENREVWVKSEGGIPGSITFSSLVQSMREKVAARQNDRQGTAANGAESESESSPLATIMLGCKTEWDAEAEATKGVFIGIDTRDGEQYEFRITINLEGVGSPGADEVSQFLSAAGMPTELAQLADDEDGAALTLGWWDSIKEKAKCVWQSLMQFVESHEKIKWKLEFGPSWGIEGMTIEGETSGRAMRHMLDGVIDCFLK